MSRILRRINKVIIKAINRIINSNIVVRITRIVFFIIWFDFSMWFSNNFRNWLAYSFIIIDNFWIFHISPIFIWGNHRIWLFTFLSVWFLCLNLSCSFFKIYMFTLFNSITHTNLELSFIKLWLISPCNNIDNDLRNVNPSNLLCYKLFFQNFKNQHFNY